jgi:hypothetical protein
MLWTCLLAGERESRSCTEVQGGEEVRLPVAKETGVKAVLQGQNL